MYKYFCLPTYHSLELQSVIQNQLKILEPNSDKTSCEPSIGRLSKDMLTRWKHIISTYQQRARDQYLTPTVSINPFFLPRKSMSPSRFSDKDFREQECLYFICDTTAGIILYVGDTARTSKQIQGAYDFGRYIECYEDLNSEFGLKTALKIAYWSGYQEVIHTRYELASALIKEWNTPLNKENWLF